MEQEINTTYFEVLDIIPHELWWELRVRDLETNKRKKFLVMLHKSHGYIFAPGFFFKVFYECLRNDEEAIIVHQAQAYEDEDTCRRGIWEMALHGHHLDKLTSVSKNTFKWFTSTSTKSRRV